jgi:hypothetical protein
MNFIEAVKECDKGNKTILVDKDGESVIIYKSINHEGIEYLCMGLEEGWAKYTPLIEDILSENWEVLE